MLHMDARVPRSRSHVKDMFEIIEQINFFDDSWQRIFSFPMLQLKNKATVFTKFGPCMNQANYWCS